MWNEFKLLYIVGVFLFLYVIGIFGMVFYGSSVKAEVYRRNGFNVTTWECFWGATPIKLIDRDVK